MNRHYISLIILVALGVGTPLAAYSKNPVPSRNPVPAKKPELNHPLGQSVGDIMELFVQDNAPAFSDYKTCHQDTYDFTQYSRDAKLANFKIAKRIVKSQRARAHWCYYIKLLGIINPLEKVEITERMSEITKIYSYLAPISKAFFEEYDDPNYLVMAGYQYRQISKRYFRRKLEFGASTTKALVNFWKRKRLNDFGHIYVIPKVIDY